MLTMADKGGSGGLDPPFLADIICEQPLTRSSHKYSNREGGGVFPMEAHGKILMMQIFLDSTARTIFKAC